MTRKTYFALKRLLQGQEQRHRADIVKIHYRVVVYMIATALLALTVYPGIKLVLSIYLIFSGALLLRTLLRSLFIVIVKKSCQKVREKHEKPAPESIGPFLCRPSCYSMGFWISFHNAKKEVIFQLRDSSGNQHEAIGRCISDKYSVWLGECINLKPDTEYTYQVLVDGQVLELSWDDSLKFKTFSEEVIQETKLITMSCHGVDAWENEKSVSLTWQMWSKVNAAISELKIDLIVLGGDQVYMDDVFEPEVQSFEKLSDEEYATKIKSVYYQYWSNRDYQRSLGRCPSVLMWDDHDLIDGFGSRLESFKGNNLTPGWQRFKEQLSEAFFVFQACRNPHTSELKENYTFILEHPKFDLIGLDLRSERNSSLCQLISDNTKGIIKSFLEKNKDKMTYIVSPVTITRISDGIEKGLGELANAAWRSLSKIGHGPNPFKVFVWTAAFAVCFLCLQVPDRRASTLFCSILLFFISLAYLVKALRPKDIEKGKLLWTVRILSGLFLVFSLLGVVLTALKGIEPAIDYWKYAQSLYEVNKVNLSIFGFSIFLGQFFLYLGAALKVIIPKISNGMRIVGLSLFGLSILIFFWFGLADKNLAMNLFVKIPLWGLSFAFLLLSFLESMHVIDEVAGMDDDIKDSWSSQVNRKQLAWFLELLGKQKKPLSLLCGDIHTGGYSVIEIDGKYISQITSSPISYTPMPSFVEKVTSGANVIELPLTMEKTAKAENKFFISERNFVILSMNKESRNTAEFIFENHNKSLLIELDSPTYQWSDRL